MFLIFFACFWHIEVLFGFVAIATLVYLEYRHLVAEDLFLYEQVSVISLNKRFEQEV